MCGIVGKLNFDGREPVQPGLIRRMTDAIGHRGPDGKGEYLSGPVGLGHRRLSIIGLENGAQPMSNEDGTVWVVYNGEIYNYPELRRELAGRGHFFSTDTDTEVIVHLYEESGAACVERLMGMFAFALWDERQRALLLARDRVGIKPLYYVETATSLLFASEIKSLLADPAVERRFEARALDRFLTYYYLPGSETLFAGIRKLEPGHTLTVRDGRKADRQYWDLRFDRPQRWSDYEEAVEALQGLLQTTVRNHLLSDVPVGILLSGGVDSTGILRYAAGQSPERIHSFTVGFGGETFDDERPFARLAAERYGTVHHEVTVSKDDFREMLPRYVWHMEEPVCEPPAVSLYFLSRCARESSIKVLLSGEGGDEAFGGYTKYRNLIALEALKSAFGPARPLLQAGMEMAGHAGWKRLSRYAPFVPLPPSRYYYSCTSSPYTFFNRHKAALYTGDFAEILGSRVSDEPTRQLFSKLEGQPLLHQMLHIDTKTWLPDDLLVKADKMTMAVSVELRVPFLDSQVLEFAASLPPRFKVKRWSTKRILKQALRDSVPDAILRRRKAGFPIPFDRWLRTDLKEYVYSTVLHPQSILRDYFRADALSRILNAHQRGEGCSQEVFGLLILDLLHRQFVCRGPLLQPLP